MSKKIGQSRQNVDRWNALRGLLWDVTERRAEATEAIQAPRPQIIRLPLTPRRRYVTRADLRKYGVAIGCSACADCAVQEKISKLLTEECRKRLGEQMEHGSEGHDRLQVHRRRRDVEPEVEVDRALVARGHEGGPAPLQRQDVEMRVGAPVESASVNRGSDAVADNEERARLRLRAEGKRPETRKTRCTGTPGQEEGQAGAREES